MDYYDERKTGNTGKNLQGLFPGNCRRLRRYLLRRLPRGVLMHPSIKYSDGITKTNDTDSETTYILCPSPDCELYFMHGKFPCEHDCPWESKQKKIIRCWSCGKLIELDGNHCSWCRVDCECGAQNMQRMSGKYRLLFEMPKVPM